VAVFAAAPVLIRLFLKDAALVETSVLMLRVQAVSQVLVAVVMFMTILAQSTGQVFYSLVLSVSRQGVVFLAVLFIASRAAGYYGVIAAQTIADLITAFMAVVLYRTGLRRTLRRLA
jgi:Na+-driven multidrug efflux pump